MKAYGGVDVYSHVFLTSAVVGGEWSASRLCRFTPGVRAPGAHWVGGWVDPRDSLDDLEKENSCPYRDSNSNLSVVQPVASRYTDCAIPAHIYFAIQLSFIYEHQNMYCSAECDREHAESPALQFQIQVLLLVVVTYI
jgi:hypothetical protein